MVFGIIFDIKELALHDGPGIRTTVFFKGCPLRCKWCHNPEGLSFKRELMVSKAACIGCNRCKEVCEQENGNCILCGKCISVCPLNLRKICGEILEAKELTQHLLKNKEFLEENEGGITISGGEPLSQPEFLRELISELDSMHICIETSGYTKLSVFAGIVNHVDLVLFDIKHTDPIIHKEYTGVNNALILKNLNYLCESENKFIVRIPLIPGVNDSIQNMQKITELVKNAKNLVEVHFLPYHKTAGAKYPMVGKEYSPGIDENQPPQIHKEIFDKVGIKSKLL